MQHSERRLTFQQEASALVTSHETPRKSRLQCPRPIISGGHIHVVTPTSTNLMFTHSFHGNLTEGCTSSSRSKWRFGPTEPDQHRIQDEEHTHRMLYVFSYLFHTQEQYLCVRIVCPHEAFSERPVLLCCEHVKNWQTLFHGARPCVLQCAWEMHNTLAVIHNIDSILLNGRMKLSDHPHSRP